MPGDSPVCYTPTDERGLAAGRFERFRCAIDATTVRRIAHLARVAVADDEVEHLRGEINAILAFVEQLSEVNVEGVEPMTSVTPMVMKKRADVVTDGGDADAVLGTRRPPRRTISWCPRWWNRCVMACEEMHLFYAYLDAVEEAKRKAQPWQCEVTVIPQGDGPHRRAIPASAKPPAQAAKSGFSCDEPE